jgi:hypothetical protein
MKPLNQLCLAVTGALMASGVTVASVVYEASYSDVTKLPYYYSPNTYGDEITLAGTDRVLTGISFSYYSDYALADGLRFILWANNGPGGAPGTILFQDVYDVVVGTSGVDVDIPFTPDPTDPLPNSFTWGVRFLGDDIAGLLVADAPSVGSSYNDFWEREAGVWKLKQLPGYTANFEAKITAVPEAQPGMAAALMFGAWGTSLVLRRKRA